MAALLSVWIALGALVTALLVVFTRMNGKESVVTLLPYTLAFSVTLAAAVLWAHRKKPVAETGVNGQRVQAVSAIALNALTFAVLLFWLHGVSKGLAGLALEGGFLAFVYWLYTRVLVPEK
jgi:hypothetical protein